jgi:hypothetical protein
MTNREDIMEARGAIKHAVVQLVALFASGACLWVPGGLSAGPGEHVSRDEAKAVAVRAMSPTWGDVSVDSVEELLMSEDSLAAYLIVLEKGNASLDQDDPWRRGSRGTVVVSATRDLPPIFSWHDGVPVCHLRRGDARAKACAVLGTPAPAFLGTWYMPVSDGSPRFGSGRRTVLVDPTSLDAFPEPGPRRMDLSRLTRADAASIKRQWSGLLEGPAEAERTKKGREPLRALFAAVRSGESEAEAETDVTVPVPQYYQRPELPGSCYPTAAASVLACFAGPYGPCPLLIDDPQDEKEVTDLIEALCTAMEYNLVLAGTFTNMVAPGMAKVCRSKGYPVDNEFGCVSIPKPSFGQFRKPLEERLMPFVYMFKSGDREWHGMAASGFSLKEDGKHTVWLVDNAAGAPPGPVEVEWVPLKLLSDFQDEMAVVDPMWYEGFNSCVSQTFVAAAGGADFSTDTGQWFAIIQGEGASVTLGDGQLTLALQAEAELMVSVSAGAAAFLDQSLSPYPLCPGTRISLSVEGNNAVAGAMFYSVSACLDVWVGESKLTYLVPGASQGNTPGWPPAEWVPFDCRERNLYDDVAAAFGQEFAARRPEVWFLDLNLLGVATPGPDPGPASVTAWLRVDDIAIASNIVNLCVGGCGPPTISRGSSSEIELRWATGLGWAYQVETSSDLLTWAPRGEPREGDDEAMSFTDLMADALRFYRIKSVPKEIGAP